MSDSIQEFADYIDNLVAHHDQITDHGDDAEFQSVCFQRTGATPTQLIQYMNQRHYRDISQDNIPPHSHGDTYDDFVSLSLKSPKHPHYKGKEMSVWYGSFATELGKVLIGETKDGVCYLGFYVDQSPDIACDKMKKHLRYADFKQSDEFIKNSATQIMKIWHGDTDQKSRLTLDLHGTDLQLDVWKILLTIPMQHILTYYDIAKKIGNPRASRAVGNAVGANPVSLLIPCHRVIRSTGIIDNYGWGSPRKKLLLGIEHAQYHEAN